jgi:hypothetical protein
MNVALLFHCQPPPRPALTPSHAVTRRVPSMDASIVSNGSSPTADAAARVDSVVLTRRRLNARRSRSSSNAESAGTMCAPAWFGWWREAARVRFG